VLVTVDPGPARDAWIPLLELADEPVPLSRYLNDGDLYDEVDAAGVPLAAVLIITVSADEAELRAVAVSEAEQGHGRGTKIVEAVFERLRDDGVRHVIVGTASSGVRQLAFYQRLGFRLTHIEPDFFTAARGYPPGLDENGIPTRDMVWMRISLR
jgi:ribosomal protein S18 acetylase RimI-like enzyme